MNNIKKSHGRGKRALINILLTAIVGFALFYIYLPAVNLQNPGIYMFIFVLAAVFSFLSVVSLGMLKAQSSGIEAWHAIKKHASAPVVICVLLLILLVLGSVISAPIFRAGAYQKLLKVEEGDFTAEVEEISFNQIPMLDEASAMKLGNRKMGELADMVSQFEVAGDYTQINYNSNPVRVTPLIYGDLIKWLNNRSEGLPAYLIINMVTQEVEVVRLGEGGGMKYSTGEHFQRNLSRLLRFNYPTYMFDTATFEIDEEGTPYWIAPRVLKRIGLFGGKDIDGAVLVNAVTGECTYYESADVPNWVDRVYTAGLIIEQYDYHGLYKNGWLNSMFGQKNVTVTTDGYNYIAINDDVYMYTGITSVSSDESNIGFILANQRTKETKFYAIAGAEEYSAMSSAEGVVQQYKYNATFPLLLNIANQPTYFMALKDSAGLVKMFAMVNVRQYQLVAYATTVAECESNYIQLLAQNDLAAGGRKTDFRAEGIIDEILTAVIDGNTNFYFRLRGQDYYYVISSSDSEIAVVLKEGDRVIIGSASEEGEIRSAYNIDRA